MVLPTKIGPLEKYKNTVRQDIFNHQKKTKEEKRRKAAKLFFPTVTFKLYNKYCSIIVRNIKYYKLRTIFEKVRLE